MARKLTGEAFKKLLACFHPDPEKAGEIYEETRRMLLRRVFERPGVRLPDALVDETFDRVAQKLEGGAEIGNLKGFCYKTATLILKEYWKLAASRPEANDESELPDPPEWQSQETDRKEALDRCLEHCLSKLPPETRALILEYCGAEHGKGEELAARLGIRREALANRMKRLRDKLEDCIHACLDHGSKN